MVNSLEPNDWKTTVQYHVPSVRWILQQSSLIITNHFMPCGLKAFGIIVVPFSILCLCVKYLYERNNLAAEITARRSLAPARISQGLIRDSRLTLGRLWSGFQNGVTEAVLTRERWNQSRKPQSPSCTGDSILRLEIEAGDVGGFLRGFVGYPIGHVSWEARHHHWSGYFSLPHSSSPKNLELFPVFSSKVSVLVWLCGFVDCFSQDWIQICLYFCELILNHLIQCNFTLSWILSSY